MAEEKIALTSEGIEKFEAELLHLKTFRRKDVAEKLKEARGQGDLSENAEYDAAKDEQAEIEARIVQLEKMLRNAEVIDLDDVSAEVISIGCHVELEMVNPKGNNVTYAIVGSVEADPGKGKISNECPLGIAILGKKEGEQVIFSTTNTTSFEYKVVKFWR